MLYVIRMTLSYYHTKYSVAIFKMNWVVAIFIIIFLFAKVD